MDGNNGFILPPTPDDYRRMWEAENEQKKQLRGRLSADQAKRQAYKEVLKDALKKQITPNQKYTDKFTSEVKKALRGG